MSGFLGEKEILRAGVVGPGTTILSILDFDAKGEQDARC